MTGKCRVCINPDISHQVDMMIKNGYSNVAISNALGSSGVEISRSSVARHRQNHYTSPVDSSEVPDLVTDTPRDELGTRGKATPVPLATDPEQVFDELRQSVKAGQSRPHDRLLLREELLLRIADQQLATIYVEQRRYLADEGRYPVDAIRALSAIEGLLDKTMLYNKSLRVVTEEHMSNKGKYTESRVRHAGKSAAKTWVKTYREGLLVGRWIPTGNEWAQQAGARKCVTQRVKAGHSHRIARQLVAERFDTAFMGTIQKVDNPTLQREIALDRFIVESFEDCGEELRETVSDHLDDLNEAGHLATVPLAVIETTVLGELDDDKVLSLTYTNGEYRLT